MSIIGNAYARTVHGFIQSRMLNKGKATFVISLDPIHHTITVGSRQVELQPLTFALFAKLFEHKNQILSIDTLTDEVWGNVTVSPDTLKQRIFLLRKALEEAGVKECAVQSVRGRGYRLLVPEKRRSSTATNHRRKITWAIVNLVVVLVAIYVWQSRQPFDMPSNNRVVFWTLSPSDMTDGREAELQQLWITKLSSGHSMIFVVSERDPEQTLSEQARKTRAALISRWSVFESDGKRWLRMQLLEPKTASILRSDVVLLDNRDELADVLIEPFIVIGQIMDSGVLPLSSDALNNTDHSAWAKLRELANTT